MRVADEMNHHPHVASGELDITPLPSDESSNWRYALLTVTCTTHQPRGLSGKDARLAARIDDLALTDDRALDIINLREVPVEQVEVKDVVRRIREEQARLVRENRRAITDALSSCGCAEGKARSTP